MVVLENVSITYAGARRRPPVVAVQEISFSISRGEKFVILGPSGCGKSTLLTAMGGFIPVSSGAIKVDGKSVKRPSMNKVMVFQDFGQLFPWRTVSGNIEWAIAKRWPSMAPAERGNRTRHYLELVGLGPQAHQYANTLSGGQKQRCAIARSFAVEPQILLMDEPFGALDAINRERMQLELNRVFESEAQDVTMAFVTHDVNEALILGHRVMVMSRGPGRLRAIVSNPGVGNLSQSGEMLNLARELRELLTDQPGVGA